MSNRKKRKDPEPLRLTDFIVNGRDGCETMLMYPFPTYVDKQLEELAAEDLLHFMDWMPENSPAPPRSTAIDGAIFSPDKDATHVEGHKKLGLQSAVIEIQDFERLNPGVYLNDVLINFWFKW